MCISALRSSGATSSFDSWVTYSLATSLSQAALGFAGRHSATKTPTPRTFETLKRVAVSTQYFVIQYLPAPSLARPEVKSKPPPCLVIGLS
jgi:hypothetical protein